MLANLTPSRSTAQLETILDVVRNEKTYSERLGELKRAEDNANEAVSKLTKARNLDNAIKRAQADEEKAKQTLSHAQHEASRLIKDAEERSQTMLSQADDQRKAIENESSKLAQSLKETKAELGMLETQRLTLIQQNEQLSANAAVIMDEAMKLKEEYENKLARLRERLKDV